MKRAMWAVMAMAGVCGAASADDGPAWKDTYRVGVAVSRAIERGDLGVFTRDGREDRSWGLALISGVASEGDAVILHQAYFGQHGRYFYPASTIKLYAALAAYEQINALARMHPDAELTERTALRFHPLAEGAAVRETDPTRERSTYVFGEPPITIEHEAHKVFVVSDNPAFNTLYDFVGQRDLNHRIRAWGAQSTMVTHWLAVARTEEENRRTPRIDLGLRPGSPQVGERYSTLPHVGPDRILMSDETMLLGTGFMRDGELVREPFDFSTKNFTTLRDLQLALVRLVRPDVTHWECCPTMTQGSIFASSKLGPLPGRPLDLTGTQREQLIASATMYPRASESPRYDPAEYPDDRVKFLLPGLIKVRPLEEWRVVNKIGLAYGFVTENAYVEHRPTGNAVFVAAVIHRNPNGIYNDNQYDYGTTLSEMAALGEVVGRALVGED
ncbi:MAG: class A beta-lactamase-related serine hydrolase [Phycisphaerales bacterium]|nr:serine hydrolase [Planctomycetota bacterium]MCH8509162.1 class A beta-lactamase-related serine hydrolase [Phycisphaerales bacterium]